MWQYDFFDWTDSDEGNLNSYPVVDLEEASENGREDVKIRGMRFTDITLDHFYLRRMDAVGTKWHGASLVSADICLSDFSEAELNDMDLSRVIAQCVTFRNASMLEVDLYKADLDGADLRGANLTGAKNFGTASFELARYDDTTIWPVGFTAPEEALGDAC